MIPILFDKTETAFTSNGIGRLTDCISCTVTEERNGIYEVELEYPITGKWYHEMISNGGIIGVIHDDNHDIQPFDIYMSSQPIDGVVTFYAHHISYRLNNIMLQPFTATSASDAISKISTNSVNTNPFTFSTDKTVSAQFTLNRPSSVRSILFGQEGSLLDTFGTAEFKFDKFNVEMLLHRGTDTGVTVRYGKNMTDLERTLDESGTFNAIAPYWTDGINVVYPTGIIVQPSTPVLPLKPAVMDFSDRFEQQPTKAELATAAQNYLDTYQPWLTEDNIKINFIAMWQSPEYADVAAIQRVGLCDTVSVYYTDMGVVAEKKEVVRVVFDVLAERFEEMELGSVFNSYVAIDNGTTQGTVNIDHVLNGKVSKSGDTMTGNLLLSNASSNVSVTMYGYEAEVGVASGKQTGAVLFRDKNGTSLGLINGGVNGSGNPYVQLYGRRVVNGTTVYNNLHLSVDSNGDGIVSMNFPEAWRSALGLGTSGALPITIAQGGTGATTAEGAASNLGVLKRYTINSYNAITTSVKRKLSFSAGVQGTLRVFGNSSARCGEYIVWGSASTVVVEPIKAASACSITTGTGYFQITSTSGSIYADFLTGSSLSRISETAGT